MEELDLLKKDWKKNEHSFNQVSEKEIYTMLHRKSSSIVKWILIISILEMLLWAAVSLIGSTDDYLRRMNHEEIITYFKVFNFFNYGVILTFIYLFYKNYVNISTTASTKKLMGDIIRTRKTVQYYVWYNLTMMALSLVVGFFIALTCNPEVGQLRDKINEDSGFMVGIFAVLTLCIVVFVAIFWLFYRLVYGILLRKLLANYKELKKIDL